MIGQEQLPCALDFFEESVIQAHETIRRSRLLVSQVRDEISRARFLAEQGGELRNEARKLIKAYRGHLCALLTDREKHRAIRR
jgi:hypothetical protein